MKNLTHIADFARKVMGKPLYPYQLEIAEAILASIESHQGHIFTVMMARQSGKNQLSAVIEAYLLNSRHEGTIVKAAPTFTPQIINSRLRLLSLLADESTRDRMWTSEGYIAGLAPDRDPALLRAHAGPRVMFFSAAPESNVVGATADLLLEIDEAQDVTHEKFNRDFRPMASTKNATTILYGTAWSDETLLAQQRATNLALEEHFGQRLHFEYDWRTLAAINPAYRTYVEQEIARLGEDHIAIQTQYFLRPISGAGYLLNALQRTLLQGTHSWEDEPLSEGNYVAGMDVAGEDRPAPLSATHRGVSTPRRQRDSSILSIGRVHYNTLSMPCIEVVHQQWWTGMSQGDQFAATVALIERWGVRTLVIDSTGLGEGLSSLLFDYLGKERVTRFTFTRPSKSHLAYQLLSLISSGRLKLYNPHTSPSNIYQECWHQLCHARYRLPGPDILDMYVDPSEGHDDFLISLALLCEALKDFTPPAASAMVRPARLYSNEGPY
jgi:hypothetical protein